MFVVPSRLLPILQLFRTSLDLLRIAGSRRLENMKQCVLAQRVRLTGDFYGEVHVVVREVRFQLFDVLDTMLVCFLITDHLMRKVSHEISRCIGY